MLNGGLQKHISTIVGLHPAVMKLCRREQEALSAERSSCEASCMTLIRSGNLYYTRIERAERVSPALKRLHRNCLDAAQPKGTRSLP
jgi:hypothetical protein